MVTDSRNKSATASRSTTLVHGCVIIAMDPTLQIWDFACQVLDSLKP